MTMDKLISILNAHGVVFYQLENIIHAYIYNDNDYDILTISNDKFLCNGIETKILEWLGY